MKILFSAEREHFNSTINKERTISAIEDLREMGIPFTIAQGVYTYDNGMTCSEVTLSIDTDSYDVIEAVAELALIDYSQESVLIVGITGTAYLNRADGTAQPIGKWQEVSDITGQQAYSVIEGKKFIAA